MSGAYYNEIEPYPAAWLRNLIAAGLLPAGDVDERSIVDVRADDLRGYSQCHFFAGIGGWPYALRLAGIPDDEPIWTGSCPCQPFSVAGRGAGTADERHLWPAFHRLIAERRPPVVFGEQVASADGRLWLAGVRADLEGVGYAVGTADLCAAGIGAPHIRQRLYWVADAARERHERSGSTRGWGDGLTDGRDGGGLADADSSFATARLRGSARTAPAVPRLDRPQEPCAGQPGGAGVALCPRCGGDFAACPHPGTSVRCLCGEHFFAEERECPYCGMGDTPSLRCGPSREPEQWLSQDDALAPGHMDAWGDAILIPCGDGKARRIEPGIPPLVTGLSPGMGSVRPGEDSPFRTIYNAEGRPIGQAPWRIGMLKAYGNAIVAPLAAEFVMAWRETKTPAGERAS